jgi:hypothetical protein
VHDLHFGLEDVVFLLRFSTVLCFALEALHIVVQLTLGVLAAADIVDSCVDPSQ